MENFEFFQFHKTENLYWLIPALLLVGFYIYSFFKKKEALALFSSVENLKHLSSSMSFSRQIIKAIIIFIAALLLVVTLMKPQGDPELVEKKGEGRDIAFVLDVSKSMLAEDLKPNRLENAKLAIKELVTSLKGDRVALLVFSGNSAVKSPLTNQYFNFISRLDSVSTDDINRGGTNIGGAMNDTIEQIFTNKERNYRDIILITDGEDTVGSNPVAIAEEAGKKGIRIFTIGIGDPIVGRKIPFKDRETGTIRYVKDNSGREVRSKLDEKTLKEIAYASKEGAYISVKTGAVDLKDLYRERIASAEKREHTERKVPLYKEWFQFFLGFAIVLIVLEFIIPERKNALKRLFKRKTDKSMTINNKIALLLMIVSILFSVSCSSKSVEAVDSGNAAYHTGSYDEAVEYYNEALDEELESPEVYFNLGNAYLKKDDLEKARENYINARDKGDRTLHKKAIYNLGNLSYIEGIKNVDSDLKKSIEYFRDAISFYQDVIDKNEADKNYSELYIEELTDDSKHNIATIRLKIKDLLDRLKKEQEKQKGDQEELKKLIEQLQKIIQVEKKIFDDTDKGIKNEIKKDNKYYKGLTDKQKSNLDETKDFLKQFSEYVQKLETSMKQSNQNQGELLSKMDKVEKLVGEGQIFEGEALKSLGERNLSKAKPDEENALKKFIEALMELSPPQNNQQQQQKQNQQQQQQSQKQKQQQQQKKGENEIKKLKPEDAKKELEKQRAMSRKRMKELEDEWKRKNPRQRQDYVPVEKDW